MVYDMLDYNCLYFDIRFVGLNCKNRKIIANVPNFWCLFCRDAFNASLQGESYFPS